ncbi:MAG: (Fe-S)-binding protein [Sulfurimicrobium sp.]|nr:(Fe-S)-binding protein [Sulfurimicrobium sp.]
MPQAMIHDPHPPASTSDDRFPLLRQEAARCVACGLCLPHCPTYRKTLNEADSPRGRIFLMAALLEHKLPLSPQLVGHLDLCLGCRACENACPSKVRYGQLVDGVRAWIEPGRQRPWRQILLRRVLFDTTSRPRLLQGAGWLLRALRRPSPPVAGTYPAQGAARGVVGLFLGCVARLSDAETLHAAVFVLNQLGYAVQVAPRQTCCGALHDHGGERETAQRLARENRTAFAGLDLQVIVHAASGCGATLAEYTPPLAAPVLDISAFLAAAEGWEQVTLAPLEQTIAVHEPCLSRNVLHDQDAPYALLRRIPGATITALAGNDQCCGAAGIYALTQPEMAGKLLRDKIDDIKTSGACTIATSNPGCAMHLANGLRAEGWKVEVLHPVTLVARQMGYTK